MTRNEKDISERNLMDYPDVFADIVNVIVFDGEEVVDKDELISIAPRSSYRDGEDSLREQERDVSKRWTKGCIRIALFGLENQTDVDLDMPLRVIGYDGAAYRDEINADEDGKPKIRYPVVTLVLYMGVKKRWDKPTNLASCFDIPKGLAKFVQDYRMNLVEVAWLPDEKIAKFRSDFRFVAEYLKQKRERQDYRPTREELDHVEAVTDVLMALSGSRDLVATLEKSTGRGAFTMNKYLRQMQDDCRAEGRTEGRAEGEGRLAKLISFLLRDGKTEEVALAASDEVKRREYYTEYGIA